LHYQLALLISTNDYEGIRSYHFIVVI
jgi:hypothetical protein